MKCPKCHTVMELKKLTDKEVYYWECPNCFYEIGKPEETEEPKDKEESE